MGGSDYRRVCPSQFSFCDLQFWFVKHFSISKCTNFRAHHKERARSGYELQFLTTKACTKTWHACCALEPGMHCGAHLHNSRVRTWGEHGAARAGSAHSARREAIHFHDACLSARAATDIATGNARHGVAHIRQVLRVYLPCVRRPRTG
jgi:hypothetical protein